MATGDLSVAKRYAAALFGTAAKRNAVDAVAADLTSVSGDVASSPQLVGALHHPRISREKKSAILKGLFGGKVQPEVENFLTLLVEKNRIVLLPEILKEFLKSVDQHRGEADAEAVTAVPLSQSQHAALEKALQERFGVKVRLTTKVDASILGGLVVRVGDKLIDGSVATRLQHVSEHLKRTKVH